MENGGHRGQKDKDTNDGGHDFSFLGRFRISSERKGLDEMMSRVHLRVQILASTWTISILAQGETNRNSTTRGAT